MPEPSYRFSLSVPLFKRGNCRVHGFESPRIVKRLEIPGDCNARRAKNSRPDFGGSTVGERFEQGVSHWLILYELSSRFVSSAMIIPGTSVYRPFRIHPVKKRPFQTITNGLLRPDTSTTAMVLPVFELVSVACMLLADPVRRSFTIESPSIGYADPEELPAFIFS